MRHKRIELGYTKLNAQGTRLRARSERKPKMAARNTIVLDSETAPTVDYGDGKPHPETSRTYDIGWTVRDCNGVELAARSFVVAEVITNPDLMNSAYYASKLPQYFEGIRMVDGEWEMRAMRDIYQTFKRDCKEFGIKNVWAYNCRFDYHALNATLKADSNGYLTHFVPYGVQLNDVWSYASCVTGTRKYVDWCIEHSYFTKSGQPSTTAEHVYRYLTQDIEFIERHTAYDDACIEWDILAAARKRKAKTRHKWGAGGAAAAKLYKELY